MNRPRRTTLLMIGLTGCLVGLAASRQAWPGWLALIPAVLLISRRVRMAGLCLSLGLVAGWARGDQFWRQLQAYRQLYGQDVVLRVTARSDGVYDRYSHNLAFDAGGVELRRPRLGAVPGVIKVETIGLPTIFRGDRLELAGRLYPARGARQGSMKFAQGRVVGRRPDWLETIRLRFGAAMFSALPEPRASFGLGLLVGQRSTLPAAVGEQLSAVGLTHIIAVSGYNLTIIVRYAGKRLGRSKYQTLIISSLLITTFVLITGFSASIVRASIVNMLSLGAWYYGRELRPLLLILLAAALTAGWYPVYLWSDIGWYLSFLAFFGVLILAPLLTRRFWGEHQPGGIWPVVIESGCAQLMTTPLILFIFGEAPLVALPANLLIVPLVPLAMLLSAVAGLAGLAGGLGPWLAWPASLLLGYMLEVTAWLAGTPHAQVGAALPVAGLVLVYAVIAAVCWRWQLRTRPKYGRITDEGD